MPWSNTLLLLLWGQMSLVNGDGLSNRHLKIAAEVWKPFWMIYCSDGKEKEWGVPCPGNLLFSICRIWNTILVNFSQLLCKMTNFDEIKQSTDGKESYRGIMWELLMIMKQAKNISFTLVGSSDGLWGGTCYSSNCVFYKWCCKLHCTYPYFYCSGVYQIVDL